MDTYFIGQNGGVNDFICSDKTFSSLAAFRGLCPEEPTEEGELYSSCGCPLRQDLIGNERKHRQRHDHGSELGFSYPGYQCQSVAGSLGTDGSGRKIWLVVTVISSTGLVNESYTSCASRRILTYGAKGLPNWGLQ